MTFRRIACLGLVSALGCAHAAGTQPHEMSATAHEAAAARELAAAWSDRIDPTDAERVSIASHRRAAAEHRAAAQSLRDAEATACSGLDESDRDMSPFEHRRDIASVETLVRVAPATQRTAERRIVEGATITIRAVPGLTAEWLQRVIDCHLARNAALSHAVPEMPTCPLVLPGVTARVRSTGSAFAVDVRSEDPTTASEVVERARSLVGE